MGRLAFLSVLLLALLCSSALGQQNLGTKMKTFASWLAKMDVNPTLFSIKDLGLANGGLALFASSKIPKDTVFLTFPSENMIHAEHARDIEDIAYFLDSFPTSETNQMALLLIFEKFINPDSNWKPYLEILPTQFSTPLYFNEKELDALKGSPLLDFAVRRKNSIKAKFDEISQALENHEGPNPFRGAFTEENFNWAISIIFSRVMSVGLTTKSGSMKKFTCLVPLVDLINTGYQDEINADCRTSKDSNLVECVALTDIPAGSEILRSYEQGGLRNSEYLLDYGFAFEENEKDTLTIPLPPMDDVQNNNLKENLMRQLEPKVARLLKQNTDDMAGLTLGWKTSLTSMYGFMAFMRLLMAESKDLEPANIESVKARINDFRPISDENEKLVIDKLIEYLQSFLDKYPTTLKHDEKLLNKLYETNPEEKRNFKHAVIARYAEKRLIDNHIHNLRQYRKKLENPDKDEYKKNPAWSKLEL